MTIVPTPIDESLRPPNSATEAAPRELSPVGEAYLNFAQRYPAFVREISVWRRRRDQKFSRLAAEPIRKQRAQIRSILHDRWLKRLYAYEGFRSIHAWDQASPRAVDELSARMNLFNPSIEPFFRLRKWQRGRYRDVWSFGILKRAQQKFIADLIRAIHPPPSNQKLFNGGMPAALQAVEAAHAEGFRCGAEVDIVNFYGSLRLEGLAELLRPLPVSVVNNVIWDEAAREHRPMENRRQRTSASDEASHSTALNAGPNGNLSDGDPLLCSTVGVRPLLDDQEGLVLGAISSPIVGERILASLIATDPDEQSRTITYADNMFIMGRTEADVDAQINQLQQRLSASAW